MYRRGKHQKPSYRARHRRPRKLFALVALVWLIDALLVTGLFTGFVTVRDYGLDISVGTNNSYCGVYVPHLDFYCETAP